MYLPTGHLQMKSLHPRDRFNQHATRSVGEFFQRVAQYTNPFEKHTPPVKTCCKSFKWVYRFQIE